MVHKEKIFEEIMTENSNFQLYLCYLKGNKTKTTENFSTEPQRPEGSRRTFLSANKMNSTQNSILKENILQE